VPESGTSKQSERGGRSISGPALITERDPPLLFDEAVRDEYEEMGGTRFRQGVPLGELVYAIILTKRHLRRYIREHGLVDFAGDRVAPIELLPLELHSIQELNYQVGEFFDLALFHLTRGYEAEAARHVGKSLPA